MCKIASPVFSPHQVLEGVRFQVWLNKSLWGHDFLKLLVRLGWLSCCSYYLNR